MSDPTRFIDVASYTCYLTGSPTEQIFRKKLEMFEDPMTNILRTPRFKETEETILDLTDVY